MCCNLVNLDTFVQIDKGITSWKPKLEEEKSPSSSFKLELVELVILTNTSFKSCTNSITSIPRVVGSQSHHSGSESKITMEMIVGHEAMSFQRHAIFELVHAVDSRHYFIKTHLEVLEIFSETHGE
jgi:hypothetical protein